MMDAKCSLGGWSERIRVPDPLFRWHDRSNTVKVLPGCVVEPRGSLPQTERCHSSGKMDYWIAETRHRSMTTRPACDQSCAACNFFLKWPLSCRQPCRP